MCGSLARACWVGIVPPPLSLESACLFERPGGYSPRFRAASRAAVFSVIVSTADVLVCVAGERVETHVVSLVGLGRVVYVEKRSVWVVCHILGHEDPGGVPEEGHPRTSG